MEFKDTGIEDVIIDFKPLDHVMTKANFALGESWDYERVTYDYKVNSPEENITYYIRLQGYAVEGDVDKGDAVLKLLTPLLGKHYYPHGIEYGEDEEFPPSLVTRATKILKEVKQNFKPFEK